MTTSTYEYKTIIGAVRMREQRDGETYEQWMAAPIADLVLVDDPVPPEGDGWELMATVFAPNATGVPVFVAREWRRAVKVQLGTNAPDADDIREWINEAHEDAESDARAKQKAIWQGELDDVAAKYIAKKLAEIE